MNIRMGMVCANADAATKPGLLLASTCDILIRLTIRIEERNGEQILIEE
ncbi:MAG: hypothetical protein O2960_03450 [Verrucomicrobia bacterium]|nr:hypothetical protein [Verrucomicrobiota bacterium]